MSQLPPITTIFIIIVFGASIDALTNFCGQTSCCATNSCIICCKNCYQNCSTETCIKTCIENCIQNTSQSTAQVVVPVTNVCTGSDCCNTQQCNNCAQVCTAECPTPQCKQNCVHNCIQGISQSCQSGNCNLCSGSHCCNTHQCNTCAQTCTAGCKTQQCGGGCIQNCIKAVSSCGEGTCGFCSGSRCCNTQHCNHCANACTSQCPTIDCKNTCINKCIQTTPYCEGPTCDVCIGNHCCKNEGCNNCVNQCYTQTSGCTRNCVSKCVASDPVKIEIPLPELSCDDATPVNTITKSNHTDAVNVTTNVDIQNVINNTNIIHIPVKINTTNLNTINYGKRSKTRSKITGSNIETLDNNHKPHGCCYVIHPRECYYVHREELGKQNDTEAQNQTEAKIRCFRRRHRECSDICTSPVVVIIPQNVPVPQPQPYPVSIPNNQHQRCHSVQNYPGVYCGNYQKHDCGSCYYCGGQYNPQECSVQPECPLVCRNNLFLG